MIPYAIASRVKYEGQEYLVDDIELGPVYSIIGHEKFDTRGMGLAWVDHAELSLVSDPTEESWDILWEVREREDEDE